MKTEEMNVDNVSILQLFDRIDASSAKELKAIVLGMISANKRDLLLDLSQVSFIDSSGLGMLITCLKSVKNAGGRLKISNICSTVRSIFDTTRMDRIFEIFENNQDALKSFHSTSG